MGRAVRCAVVVVLLLCAGVETASARLPFDPPGHAVRELTEMRTPQSRTWLMPSGMHVTQIAPGPVQWRDGQGDWHEYDLSLGEHGSGWEAQPGDAALTLPDRLGSGRDGAVRFADADGNWVSMSVLDGSADGSVAKGLATYRGVRDGLDLVLGALPNGVKEDAVLHDGGAAAGLVYRVQMADGLQLRDVGRSGLEVVRGERRVFSIPAPTMSDAKGVLGPSGAWELRKVDAQTWEVSARLGDGWLRASDRAWPVVVDPTVTTFNSSSSDDCQVTLVNYDTGAIGGPTQVCNTSSQAQIGVWDGGTEYDNRSQLLRFDTLTLVQSDAIDSAQLQLYRISSNAANPINVYRVKTAWSSTSAPWSTTTDWADPAPVAQVPTGTNGPVNVDLTALVAEWRSYQNSGGVQGFANRGILLNDSSLAIPNPPTGDVTTHAPVHPDEPTPQTTLSSKLSVAPATPPILQVKSWPAAAAGNAVISPGEGDLTGKRVKLQARALASSVTTVRFQYIAGSQRTWTDIPLSALSTPTRGAVSGVDIPVSGPTGDRRSDLVVWDLSAMPGGDVDGPVHVRAWLGSPTAGDGGMTPEVNFRLDRRGIDGAPTEPIGPGDLNLLSGEFSMSATDVSIGAFLQNLTLTRTYRSRGVAVRNSDMFGSGWDASVEADGGDLPYKGLYDYSEIRDVTVDRDVLDPSSWNWEAFFQTYNIEDLQPDIETVQDTEQFNYEYAIIEASDGTKMTFTQVTDPSGNVTGWTPDDLHPGFTLTRATTGTSGQMQYTLTDPDGNVATFLSESANSPSARLATFQQPGSTSNLTYTYEASGTRQRLKRVTAPSPAGTPARSLTFNWTNVGTPSVPRVTSIDYNDGYAATTTVATYSYDANARLVQETDPRISGGVRNTTYHYSTGGQLDQVTPSGEATWNLTYTRMAGDTGPRLASVSRAHPDGGTATRTVMYGVPLAGSGAPYDMSTTATAAWGQTDDLPWDAVAIWPEDTIPNLSSPDYSKATIYYLDQQGLEVNTAEPGGAITTDWHDANGNVIRELSPQGRADALAAGANSASVATDRSTLYQYASNGVDLLATREPVTQITLSTGSVVAGRRVTTTNYDENAPAGGPYHLPTSEWRAVEPTSGGQVDVREKALLDYSANGGMSGWTARHATKTIVDPSGRALTSYSILHPTYPVVEETRTPGAPNGGTTPDDQWYQYYGITPSARVPSGLAAANCNARTGASDPPGFLCLRSEATLPDASVPRRWYDYNTYGDVTNLYQERPLAYNGTGYRLTNGVYDAVGQQTRSSISGGTGTAVPSTAYSYDPATGNQTTASSSNGTIARRYDSNGRLSSYVDASGTTTAYRYDLRGRLIQRTIGTRVTTYGYDDRDNLISVQDTEVGAPITATYDLDDDLVTETLPNGLVRSASYDETGRVREVRWDNTSGCSSNCTWVDSLVTGRDADGNMTGHHSTLSDQTFTYDSAQRLTNVDDIRASDRTCVRRTYAYDAGGAGDSNRTQKVWFTSSPGGACGTGTAGRRIYSYDTADRVLNTGWAWDAFGRATSVPAPDSGGNGTLTAAYFADDMVRQLTLDGRTQSFTRDPFNRAMTIVSSGGLAPTVTTTNEYADDTDSPVAAVRSDLTMATYVDGPDAELAATDDAGTLTYQLDDVEGSVVAEAPSSSGAGGPVSRTETDEFGNVTNAATPVIDNTKGVPAYGWLGGHERATDFGQAQGSGSPIEMGVREYLPAVGRFMQVDPVDGGSANSYDYAFQNPMNEQDLSGECVGPLIVICGEAAIEIGAGVVAAAIGAQIVHNYVTSHPQVSLHVVVFAKPKKRSKRAPIPQHSGHRPQGTGKKNWDRHSGRRSDHPEKGDARRPYRRK